LVYAKLGYLGDFGDLSVKQSSPLQGYAADEHGVRKESRKVPEFPRITVPFLGNESWG